MNETVKLDIVRGIEGLCLYIDDERISPGPKPWGGGVTVATIVVSREDILRALS